MTISHAHDISLILSGRLAGISTAAGFATDIGARVYRGRRHLDEDKIPCVILVEGIDKISDEQRGRVKIEAHYHLEGHAPCDPDNPNDTAQAIIADLKRAIFGADLTLGNKTRELRYAGRTIMPREDGLSTVAAAIEIIVTYAETLAAP